MTAALRIALGGQQASQERQLPDEAGPGSGRLQHDAEPAQTTCFAEVAPPEYCNASKNGVNARFLMSGNKHYRALVILAHL